MAIDGTYGFVYCGVNGLGVGVFTISNGSIRGCDFGGLRYSGSATEDDDGSILAEMRLDVPEGAALVGGTSEQDVPYRREIKHKFPPLFGDGRPQEVVLAPGTVTIMVKMIPDEYARAATDGFTLDIAKAMTGQAQT
jgi:hypothetical protein